MKKCNKCKVEKSIDGFHNNKNFKDGKQPKCMECCKQWRDENPSYMKQYHVLNPEYNNIQQKKWRKDNPEKRKVINRKYLKKRIENDPHFKLSHSIRTLIYMSFKSVLKGTYKKGKKTENILDCTLEEFTQHLQSLFTEGMTLKNHGEWEIDHIIPISSAKNEEEIYKLNHYTNFQPLWKEDNRKKSNKMLGH